ncbi:hypothetical protein LINPERHAP1_LOCUS7169 [Linum perenne]
MACPSKSSYFVIFALFLAISFSNVEVGTSARQLLQLLPNPTVGSDISILSELPPVPPISNFFPISIPPIPSIFPGVTGIPAVPKVPGVPIAKVPGVALVPGN